MSVRSRISRFLWWVPAAAVIAVLAHVDPAAAGEECPAVDNRGNPRECTAMEEYGQCLWNGLESHEQCEDAADGFLERAACDVAWVVDYYACLGEFPLSIIT